MIAIALIQALFYRQYFRFQPKFAIIYVSVNFAATFIGIEVLVRTDSPMLTRIFGAILFITFCINLTKDCIYPRCIKKQSNQDMTSDDKNHNRNMDIAIGSADSVATPTSRHQIKGIPDDVVKYELKTWRQYLSLVIACTLSGITRGVFGAGGWLHDLYRSVSLLSDVSLLNRPTDG